MKDQCYFLEPIYTFKIPPITKNKWIQIWLVFVPRIQPSPYIKIMSPELLINIIAIGNYFYTLKYLEVIRNHWAYQMKKNLSVSRDIFFFFTSILILGLSEWKQHILQYPASFIRSTYITETIHIEYISCRVDRKSCRIQNTI